MHELGATISTAPSWPVVLRHLPTRRYAALTMLMLTVATSCVGFGTWQITRYEQKRSANAELRHNNQAALTTVADVLPLVGQGTPAIDTTEYRRVTVTGIYDAAHETLVRGQVAAATPGFYVLTPLHIHDEAGPDLSNKAKVVLVVRGLVPSNKADSPKTAVPAAPTTEVTLTGSVRLADKGHDGYGELAANQVESISPADQAARLHTEIYDGYLQLGADQPGTAGLTRLDAPDLSNPAGGAIEPQHLAYIVQWYLFAIFALAAPVIMARSDLRRENESGLDDPIDPTGTTDSPAADETARARRLADRYGS